jgi:quercetin dioxygenase-like cupin family protein
MAGGKLLEQFKLDDEIARIPTGDGNAGRRTRPLVTLDRLRVVLVTLRAGELLREHAAPGPITIQVLRGRFGVRVEGEECEVGPGGLVAIETRIGHAVRALEDGAFLLTIGWPTRMGGEPRIDI